MTLNTNEESKAAALTDLDRLYPFISDLQKASEITQLWRFFLQQFQDQEEIMQAELAYRGGILLESIIYNKKKNEMTRKSIASRTFPEPQEDFEFQLTKKRAAMFKRVDGYCIRMKLQFANTITTLIKEHEFLLLSHIFFNQVFLLLKIKNFEFHSVKDDITLAYNQNYLKAFLQNEIERSRRYGSVFSVIFFDLDNLKDINEKHGHLVGTVLLKEVAAVLRSQVRKMDLLSRFGGDEFVIVLSNANAKNAYEVCTRIKTALHNTQFLKNKHLSVNITGCFGISSFPGDGNTADELIRRADIAMYEIKRTGKDGIKIYEGEK